MHEITIRENGFAEAAFAITPAWHKLGTVLDHPMTSKEALEAAGLNWRIIQQPVARWNGKEFILEPNFVFNVREDLDIPFCVVSKKYRVVQNYEAFAFLDALVENHEMLYEAAFSIRNGKRVVLLARLPGVDNVVEGDSILRYILMSLDHNGTGSIVVKPTPVRVVCANTLAMALRGTERELRIPHRSNLDEKLEAVRHILAKSNKQFEEYLKKCKALVNKRINLGDWLSYLDALVPKISSDKHKRKAKKIEEARVQINEIFHNQRQEIVGRTAWAAFNAVSEWVDHHSRKGRTEQKKLEAQLFDIFYGNGSKLKQKAFALACELAQVT